MPGRAVTGRSSYGTGESRAVFWYGGKTGMSYALQCHNNGDNLAYGCDQRHPAVKAADGYCKRSAEGIRIPELFKMSRRYWLGTRLPVADAVWHR